jgi:hypothetical protein
LRCAVAVALAAVLTGCAAPVPPGATPTPTFAANVPCGPTERLEHHAHAHLTIVIRAELRPVPANVGITPGSICWLHTHDTTGIIHIESGDDRNFTLGDFFGVWRQQLSDTRIGAERVERGETIKVFENQQPFTGPPETIVLDDKDDIVLELGPRYPTIAPYVWPPGF